MGTEDLRVAADQFAVRAREFCELIDGSHEHAREDFAVAVRSALPKLISGVVELPVTEIETDDWPLPSRSADWYTIRPQLEALLGDWDEYREIFDPYSGLDEEPVIGSLSDDLGDIYVDLMEGLDAHDAGCVPGDAVFHWRFGFWTHWGEHATGALRALHYKAQPKDVVEPDD